MNEIAKQILELLPNDGSTLSGSQIKATLALRDLEYKAAKQELKDEGIIILGRGRSGTMALAVPGTGSDKETKILSIGARQLETLWKEVERRIEEYGCECDLQPNMSYEELLELEAGCTGTEAKAKKLGFPIVAGNMPGWICATLDYYRHQMYKFREKNE